MRRVLAVVLIAALTTVMIGIDRTSWAGQAGDQQKREKQRAAVTRTVHEMGRGSTARIERQDGTTEDVVIQAITPDSITVLRQDRDHVLTETIPLADIVKIKRTSVHHMAAASKILIGVAVAAGVLLVAGLAACASATYPDSPRGMADSTH